MRSLRVVAAALLAVFASTSALRADYLEVRRSATIKEHPNITSAILERVQPPVMLALIPVTSGTNDQVNGYYKVERQGGGEGWIYRTLVRRHLGSLEPAPIPPPAPGDGELELHFIDVGQGDCTLVKCPGDYTILVDCGSTSGHDPALVRDYLLGELDAASPRIDDLVITHPDADHYNLLPTVLAGVEVGHIYLVGQPSEHGENNVDDWLNSFSSNRRSILGSGTFDLPGEPNPSILAGDASVHILAANISATESAKNARSIVILIDYLEFEAILTGDATFDTENAILGRYPANWLDCEVLKLGHHGSSTTSTSPTWAAATRPELAVVSASIDNGYGHPRKSVLEIVDDFTVRDAPHLIRWGWWSGGPSFGNVLEYREAIYSTATSGSVAVSSNGGWFEVVTER